MTCDDPLYVMSHSKTVLSQAIGSDTQFLASQSVMDYSLLVGLDKERRELVVGIIGMYCIVLYLLYCVCCIACVVLYVLYVLYLCVVLYVLYLLYCMCCIVCVVFTVVLALKLFPLWLSVIKA